MDSTRLKEIYLEIGDRCLLNCRHCSSEAGSNEYEFIDLYNLCSIVKQGKNLGANTLVISGGEPLLHPNLLDFVHYAKRNGFEVRMYSCGVIEEGNTLSSIPNNTFTDLLQVGLNTIIFSLHGEEETHDNITGVKGSYKLVIESIQRAKLHGFNVEIHMVPMKINYKEILNVILIAEELGVEKVSLLRLVPQGRANHEDQLVMNQEEHQEFTKIVQSVNSRGSKIRIGAPYSCLFLNSQHNCSAGRDKVLIGPNGDVYPCEAFKTKLKGLTSNIFSKKLARIWKDDEMLNVIRSLDIEEIENCNKCQNLKRCFGGCHGQRFISHSAVNIGPDPICSATKK